MPHGSHPSNIAKGGAAFLERAIHIEIPTSGNTGQKWGTRLVPEGPLTIARRFQRRVTHGMMEPRPRGTPDLLSPRGIPGLLPARGWILPQAFPPLKRRAIFGRPYRDLSYFSHVLTRA